jgi:hypothetical protein
MGINHIVHRFTMIERRVLRILAVLACLTAISQAKVPWTTVVSAIPRGGEENGGDYAAKLEGVKSTVLEKANQAVSIAKRVLLVCYAVSILMSALFRLKN